METANAATIDDPPEASPESDADAARQLARAMVVNKVGAALSWEQTLRRLGLDESAGRREEVSLAQAEFDALMDSTKRKRRKKMKKHKYVHPPLHLIWFLSHSAPQAEEAQTGMLSVLFALTHVH